MANDLLAFAPEIGPVIDRILLPVAGRIITSSPRLNAAAKALPLPLALKKLFEPKKRKTKQDEADGTKVIKVFDAIRIVDSELNSLAGLSELGDALGRIMGGVPTSAGATSPLDRISQRMREECLRQDTPRQKRTKTYYSRPAKGHGRGRAS